MGCFRSEYDLGTISSPEIISLFLLTPTFPCFLEIYTSIFPKGVFRTNQVKERLSPDGPTYYLVTIKAVSTRSSMLSIYACRQAG